VARADGAVRFNFTKFKRPNLGSYSTEPLKPIDFTPAPVRQEPSSIPAG
jgi:hypothetical protein